MFRLLLIAFASALIVSCSEKTKTSTEEETEITRMDSTEKVVKEKIDELEDQTKKVEESLEKLDKEFEKNN